MAAPQSCETNVTARRGGRNQCSGTRGVQARQANCFPS